MDDDGLDDDDAVLQALANACVKYDNGWTGCLDLKEPREDPRAKNVGDDISIDESAAAADGHRQRIAARERNRSPDFRDVRRDRTVPQVMVRPEDF